MADPVKNGILLIDKPREMTSFGVVSRLRRLIGIKKIGHTGTLDPFAQGLLAICVGKATTVVQFMDTYDKTYQVRVLFGSATDTMDLTGTVTEHHDFLPGELENLRSQDFAPLREAVADLLGPSDQLPPMYSAVKIDGRPLYSLAREGQTIERKARPIIIYQATLDQVICRTAGETDGPMLAADLTLAVSKGTYIRVIADELGRRLGYFGHAQRLLRTAVGPFNLDQAVTLGWLTEQYDTLADLFPGAVGPQATQLDRRPVQDRLWQQLNETGRVRSLDEALAEYPVFQLESGQTRRLVQGQPLMFSPDQIIAGLKQDSRFPDRQVDPLDQNRLTLYNKASLIGVGHFEATQDTTQEATQNTSQDSTQDSTLMTYRLVTERIFQSHECLLPE